MYVKWETLVLSPIVDFLISTKSPTLTWFPIIDCGRIYAKGPTVVSFPITLSKITELWISTFSAIEELLILELGYNKHPDPITVLPSITLPGYIIVSFRIITSVPK